MMADQKHWKIAGLVSVVLLLVLIFKEKSEEPAGVVWSEGDTTRSEPLSEGTDAPDLNCPLCKEVTSVSAALRGSG